MNRESEQMLNRNLRPQKQIQSAMELAVAAVEPGVNVMDTDMAGVDTDPTSLDLDGSTVVAACPHRRYVCADCGRPLRECRS